MHNFPVIPCFLTFYSIAVYKSCTWAIYHPIIPCMGKNDCEYDLLPPSPPPPPPQLLAVSPLGFGQCGLVWGKEGTLSLNGLYGCCFVSRLISCSNHELKFVHEIFQPEGCRLPRPQCSLQSENTNGTGGMGGKVPHQSSSSWVHPGARALLPLKQPPTHGATSGQGIGSGFAVTISR